MAISKVYKELSMEKIFEFCSKNKEAAAWIKEFSQKDIVRKIYPKKEHTTKKGNTTERYDKSQKPIGEEIGKPSYVEIKLEFVKKFMPELTPEKKAPKKTMADYLAEL